MLALAPAHRRLLYLIALVGVAEPVIAFDVYALWGNETAHTGLPTRWLATALLVVAAVAAGAWMAERRGPSHACRLLALGVGLMALCGAGNVLAFEHYNVLMGYEVWVREKHMPAKFAPPGQGLRVPLPPMVELPPQPVPGDTGVTAGE
ncbi:MAG: hypothetical protein ABIO70_03375 [Pseudomonadota bacterium]